MSTSANVLVTAVDSCEPRVPGDHLYKIYWLPSPLETGGRWWIALTVSLMSPQYGTIRGLSLVSEGRGRALIGCWPEHWRAGMTSPPQRQQVTTIQSAHNTLMVGWQAREFMFCHRRLLLLLARCVYSFCIWLECTHSWAFISACKVCHPLNWCSVFWVDNNHCGDHLQV